MYIHRNLAKSHHPRPNTEAVSKILNTSIIAWFQKKFCTLHRGNFYFRLSPLEFSFNTDGVACHSPPPPGIWLSTLWKVYLCPKYCISVKGLNPAVILKVG